MQRDEIIKQCIRFECQLRTEFGIPWKFNFEKYPELLSALAHAAERKVDHEYSGSQESCSAYDELVTQFAKWMASRFFNADSVDGLHTVRV